MLKHICSKSIYAFPFTQYAESTYVLISLHLPGYKYGLSVLQNTRMETEGMFMVPICMLFIVHAYKLVS